MHIRKNMLKNNKGFTCNHCKTKVKPHEAGSCRNHCTQCLYSLHVDLEVPGDRDNECKGLMIPIGIKNDSKHGARLIHMCQHCGAQTCNRIAPDDNWDLICEISRIPQM